MGRLEAEHIILSYLLNFKLKKVGIFGSYARNEQNSNSDIDILVKFNKTPSLLKLIRIENELSKRLGCKVDLVTEDSITNKFIKSQISKEIQIIYHA
jgi:predicted nucleotidyltransferase